METKTKNLTLELILNVVDSDVGEIETRKTLDDLQTAIPGYIAEKFDNYFKLIDFQEDELDGTLSVLLFFESK